MRENAWKEIGISLGLSGDLCRTRFKVLRDRYRKEKAKVLPSESEAKARKMWHFSEMLSFLDPYMQKGRIWEEVGIIHEAEIVHKAGTVQEVGIVQENSFNLTEISVPTPTTSRKPTLNSKKRKRAREDLIDAALTDKKQTQKISS
ncbi:hypothetical protein TNIN_493271 [Trichonephila inaurata madagascariensis]|uniref:MADF domain-containing protein n=1 Tax=Trichonephila inaurata madagascariensis TaxID=2747483 RepID=A0A8X6YEI3_9ARAC|nr:hypothetical protein TNIN_493271 [Trichonephila inaurata madagascariensis]